MFFCGLNFSRAIQIALPCHKSDLRICLVALMLSRWFISTVLKMQSLLRFSSFLFLALLKLLSTIFYRGERTWLSKEQEETMKDVRLVVLLNHTSLFEPLFIRFAPWSWVWTLAQRLVVPAADVTMKRPLTGMLLKLLMPGCIPISRKNDHSWLNFLSHINSKTITGILPEGRMKRRDGKDKFGRPMSVRAGVADILDCLDDGKILFVYSAGLHHIQTPGERLPRVFKTIKANLELVDISDYKKQLEYQKTDVLQEQNAFKRRVIADMNQRLEEKVPSL